MRTEIDTSSLQNSNARNNICRYCKLKYMWNAYVFVSFCVCVYIWYLNDVHVHITHTNTHTLIFNHISFVVVLNCAHVEFRATLFFIGSISTHILKCNDRRWSYFKAWKHVWPGVHFFLPIPLNTILLWPQINKTHRL